MRKEIYIVLIILTSATLSIAQTRSTKRGLAYGHNTTSDLSALTKGVSWYYNWYHAPELSNYSDYSIDYTPMAWTASFNKDAMHTFLSTHPNVKYVLGWNEPNFTTQANLGPKEAASHWKDIESLATEFNLKTVSPAVNYCDKCITEDGVTYSDPVKYLDAFFAACTDCQVDYIAIHCYMNNISALQWYVGLFKKYGKPIWLTEFCSWEGADITTASQQSYMIGAIDYLENDPDVFRYAWFTGRQDTPYPYNAVLGSSGELTDLGKIFVNTPPHDSTAYVTLPSLIEAESYSKMSGILLEKTSDASGTANVGYIDAGDWLEYNVNAVTKDTFNIYIRNAANQSGNITILVDGATQESFTIPSTGGWQSWATVETKKQLILEGKHKLRIKASSGGFNLNWIEIKKPIPEVVAGINSPGEYKLAYPNPVKGILNIDKTIQVEQLDTYDLRGEHLTISYTNELDFTNHKPGVYILKVTTKNKVIIQKIIKE